MKKQTDAAVREEIKEVMPAKADGLEIELRDLYAANGTYTPEEKVATEETIPLHKIINLSGKVNKDYLLKWKVPAGKWTILRFGHTCVGRKNHPAPVSGLGLECDKLSKKGAEAHFAGFMRKLINDIGPLAGKTLVSTHIDSWEVGNQNWTPKFREEFQRICGYDILPFLGNDRHNFQPTVQKQHFSNPTGTVRRPQGFR